MPDDQASDVDLLVYFAVVSPKVVQKWKPVTSARQNLKIVNILKFFLVSSEILEIIWRREKVVL